MRMPADSPDAFVAHDLAHRQLQRQAVLALLLLRHIAHQAAHRQRNARLLTAAQAQFQFQHAAVGVWWRREYAVHQLAVEGAAEKRGHLAADAF
jgi:hypothetical protein